MTKIFTTDKLNKHVRNDRYSTLLRGQRIYMNPPSPPHFLIGLTIEVDKTERCKLGSDM